MKTEKNILIAFILNLSFSIFEFFGGALTGSVAIISDAVHDIGDAASIGLSYFLEKKSKQQPDKTFTYGYARYSVIGSVITTLILLFGSVMVIYNAIIRIFRPVPIHYNGMIIFAVFGVIVNLAAAYFTREGDSLNQKAVNLHMLEDVLGWVIVLVGAIVMRFTDFAIIDSFLSIGVALFIFYNAIRNLKEAIDLFLEKLPHGVDLDEIKEHLLEIEGVKGVHHIHIWSIDGYHHYATLHIVTEEDGCEIKERVKAELREHGIGHATVELENCEEHCHEEDCCMEFK
ncbi:MAG: cation diffusion facilitator family transporter, partial [Eubacteriales bacterium]|nr:cation diffusion facilitator family transporter [Eubacteriales bacterium]